MVGKERDLSHRRGTGMKAIGDILFDANLDAWDKYFIKGDFSGAKDKADSLYPLAKKEIEHAEVILALILCTRAWSEYKLDGNSGAHINRTYVSAKEGLAALEKNKWDDWRVHELRSSLLLVAASCEAYLVNELDEKAEPLFRQAIEEAEKSKLQTRREAKGMFAFWLISPEQKRFKEAIPLFQDAIDIEEKLSRKRPAGDLYNVLAFYFNKEEKYEDAVVAADKALMLYGDPNHDASFRARLQKTFALRGLGKQKNDIRCFEQALAIYEESKRIRSEDLGLTDEKRKEILGNYEKHIAETKEEMRKLNMT